MDWEGKGDDFDESGDELSALEVNAPVDDDILYEYEDLVEPNENPYENEIELLDEDQNLVDETFTFSNGFQPSELPDYAEDPEYEDDLTSFAQYETYPSTIAQNLDLINPNASFANGFNPTVNEDEFEEEGEFYDEEADEVEEYVEGEDEDDLLVDDGIDDGENFIDDEDEPVATNAFVQFVQQNRQRAIHPTVCTNKLPVSTMPVDNFKFSVNPFLAEETKQPKQNKTPVVSITKVVDNNLFLTQTQLQDEKDRKPETILHYSESDQECKTKKRKGSVPIESDVEILSTDTEAGISKSKKSKSENEIIVNPFLNVPTKLTPTSGEKIMNPFMKEKDENKGRIDIMKRGPNQKIIFDLSDDDEVSEVNSEATMAMSKIIQAQAILAQRKNPRTKNRNKSPQKICPPEIEFQPEIKKYWKQRRALFTRFDEGIKLDIESWFSVTPENIAIHIAERCATQGTIIDAFCGCGGNTIQFAKTCRKVIAIDIDPVKIEYAKHNARIYGVENKIDFIVADFMAVAPVLRADVVFLSPPWGGPDYQNTLVFDLKTMIPMNGYKVFKLAQAISPNIAYFVPRNVDRDQLAELAGPLNFVDIESNLYEKRVKTITAYYGSLIQNH